VEFRRRPDINLVNFRAAPAGTMYISVTIVWLSWCDDRFNVYGLYYEIQDDRWHQLEHIICFNQST